MNVESLRRDPESLMNRMSRLMRLRTGGELLVDLLGDLRSEARDGRHVLRIDPYGYHWLRVGGRTT